jgi:hypothetical protein
VNRSAAIVSKVHYLTAQGEPLRGAVIEALAKVPASKGAQRLAVATLVAGLPSDVAAQIRELVDPPAEARQPRPISTAPNSIASRLAKSVLRRP